MSLLLLCFAQGQFTLPAARSVSALVPLVASAFRWGRNLKVFSQPFEYPFSGPFSSLNLLISLSCFHFRFKRTSHVTLRFSLSEVYFASHANHVSQKAPIQKLINFASLFALFASPVRPIVTNQQCISWETSFLSLPPEHSSPPFPHTTRSSRFLGIANPSSFRSRSAYQSGNRTLRALSKGVTPH